MSLNIKSQALERDIRRLAEMTGETLTEALHQAVRERLRGLSIEGTISDELSREQR
ncbi:MAG: type II toxin-antitoxin system VapB family antitoxin [Niveispirillum sp.]|nr:type II toxin-antitoxin system VapB family antitoxin [Niveispirillum sp.]